MDNDDDGDDDDQCGLVSGLINGRPGDRARAFIYYSRMFIIGGFAKRKKYTDRTDVSKERNNDPNNHHYKIYKCLFTRNMYIKNNKNNHTIKRRFSFYWKFNFTCIDGHII